MVNATVTLSRNGQVIDITSANIYMSVASKRITIDAYKFSVETQEGDEVNFDVPDFIAEAIQNGYEVV